MKKKYMGLEVIRIPFASEIITTASTCSKIYVTHFDYDNNGQCDDPENTDGEGKVVQTESWTDEP